MFEKNLTKYNCKIKIHYNCPNNCQNSCQNNYNYDYSNNCDNYFNSCLLFYRKYSYFAFKAYLVF